MGKGNWLPDDIARHYTKETFRNQLYIELLPITDYEEHDETDVEMAQGELLEILKNALPDSFNRADNRMNSNWFGHGFAVDTAAVFYNRQVIVVWDISADPYHQGVGVVVNPDAYVYKYGGLAERAAAETFERIKTALLNDYPNRVSVRTSAWTSSRLAA